MWKYDYEQITQKCEEYGIDKLLEDLNVERVNISGTSIRSCCPIHGGTNETSFKYYNGYFTCFSKCGKSYSIIDLIKFQKGLDFKGAIQYLKKSLNTDFRTTESVSTRVSIDNKNFTNLMKKRKEKIDFQSLSLDGFSEYFHPMFLNEGFTEECLKHFQIRFCTEGALGKRQIIPIDNEDNIIVGLSGRSILPEKDLDFLHISKYRFTTGFDKSKVLYNLGRAKEQIKKSEYLIVVEGYKSVWRLYQWGYYNVVALMGAKPSDYQTRLLIKQWKKLIICGDRDIAGANMNKMLSEKTSNYVDSHILDLYKLDIPEKSSIAELSQEQFEYLLDRTLLEREV